MKHPWQIDETIQVGTNYLDEKEVQAYDRQMRSLRDIKKEMDEVINELGISKHCTVWEIGTGTGECALALAEACKKVYATDVSETMLKYAQRKANERDITNIVFEKGGFLSGFQPPGPVDFIMSQLALHHLPDFWKSRALSVIAAKLKPGGKFYLRDVVFSSEINDYESYFYSFIEGIRAAAGDKVADETILHIKEEYSTLDWIIEGMIERAGLKITKKDNQKFFSTYICER